MSESYREMWKGLGLDLDAHDALLSVLGGAYGEMYLSQKDRPAAMGYFDFVMTEVHGLRVKELMDAKAQGRKVIGSFCLFFPEELALAVDAISVGLCTGAAFGTELAEEYLPRTTCDLIKSAFGFKLGKVCPYMEASDLIVGENTCDGKKKAWEEFAPLAKKFFAMDLPQTKSDSGRKLMRAEYDRLRSAVEELAGKKITVDGLRWGIATANLKREALNRLDRLRAASPAPISGMDALLVAQLSFFDDPARFVEMVDKLCDELEDRVKQGRGVYEGRRPRLLISGCPMAIPNWKLPAVVESAGAVVVGEESCVGSRGFRWTVAEKGDTVDDLLDAIAERYLKIECAVFTPNPDRLDHVREMVESQKADGVIHYNLPFCQPYQIESGGVERKLKDAGVPVLRLETGYSPEDAPALKTRVEAFLEMLK